MPGIVGELGLRHTVNVHMVSYASKRQMTMSTSGFQSSMLQTRVRSRVGTDPPITARNWVGQPCRGLDCVSAGSLAPPPCPPPLSLNRMTCCDVAHSPLTKRRALGVLKQYINTSITASTPPSSQQLSSQLPTLPTTTLSTTKPTTTPTINQHV